MEHRRYIFHGRVQGVGFRATTMSIARRHEVTGSVRNVPNGTVEIWAQGEPAELDRFVAEIASQFSGYVDHIDVAMHPVVANEGSFRIDY